MAGGIFEKKFCTHLEGTGGNSFVDFGPPVIPHMSSLDDAVSIKFQNGYFWNTIPTGIRFGNPEDRLEFMLDPTSYLILTTSSAFNFVPKSKAADFFYNIFNKYRIPYQVEGGMFVVDCNVTMPDVRFLL